MEKRTTRSMFELEEEFFCEDIEELVSYLNKCKRIGDAPQLKEVGEALDRILFHHRRMQEELGKTAEMLED